MSLQSFTKGERGISIDDGQFSNAGQDICMSWMGYIYKQ